MSISKDFPGPSPLSALANMRSFLNNRADFLLGLHQTYGDKCRFRLALYDVYFINKPELVKEVFMRHEFFHKTPATKFLARIIGDGLLLSEGDFHRRQRRLMQPVFHKKRIATYCDVMTRYAEQTGEGWKDGQEIDAHAEMMKLAQSIVAKTLFSADVNDAADRVSRAIDYILPFVDRIADPIGAIKMALPTPTNAKFKAAIKELDDVIYGFIHEARESGEDRGDLLSMLQNARDEEGDGSGMTDEQIRNEAITIYIAGHETTAVALSWTWYFLARNPEVFERLCEEVDSVLNGRLPEFEDVKSLQYTRSVIAETMRLCPPAYLIDRMPEEDWDTGEGVIPRGKYIFTSPYTMHRHPGIWSDPERFDPERWRPEEVEKRPKFAYFPFGGGARICIGEQFAWTEMILIVATLAQRWRFELATDQPIETQPFITLRPKGGIPIRLRERVGGRPAPATSAPSPESALS